MSHRTYFPFAKFTLCNLDTPMTYDVLTTLIETLLTLDWIKPSVLEKTIFKKLKHKYNIEKSLCSDFHMIKNILYTILTFMVEDKIIYVVQRDKWEYPEYKFDFGCAWLVFNHYLGRKII